MQRSDYSLELLLNSINKYDRQFKRKKCNKFIFTAIPRTASTTLHHELKNRAKGYVVSGRLSMILQLINYKNLNYNLSHMRIQALTIKNKDIIPILESHFCFLFVRNPFDRIVSLWKVHTQNNVKTAINKNGLYFGLSFKEFIKRYFEDKQSDKDKDIKVFKKTSKRLGDSQWRWTHQWLDYIGRFESLEKDFLYIKEKLNLKNKKEKIKNHVRYYKISKESKKNYKKFYKSDKLIETVYKHYKTDCDLFGYTFDKVTKNNKTLLKDSLKYINQLLNKTTNKKINKLIEG